MLNLQSEFDESEMERVRQRPLRADLARKPSKRELKNALGKMKNGKAGGSSGILPEMVKVACEDEEFLELLLALVHAVWEERRVPQEWADATLIPIPKKGNLSDCNNWRGIVLLDVVGKVVARVIQERLQQLAEEELPEAQCGFRKGRSCSDMIFTVRQLVEKAIEHRAKKFLLFVDLKKAYDSVPRTALWYALKKLGVPDLAIDIIRSFHEGMRAKVSINGELLEEIKVRNGLRQGCTMAPVLFNLYACLVFERWSSQVASMEGVGTFLLHKFDQKLFRRYTRNACESQLMDGQFADDAVLLATTRGGAEQAMMSFVRVARAFGLTVSIQKTKMMVTGYDVKDEEMAPILVGNDLIECVESFTYLGSVVTPNARIDAEVDRRIACASRAFGALWQAVFKDKNHHQETGVPGLRVVSTAIWVGVLGAPAQTSQETQYLPSSMHPYYPRHYQQTAMGATHHLSDDKGAVGGCGNSDNQSGKAQARVAWPRCSDAGPSTAQTSTIWVAATAPPPWRTSEKMERCDPAGSEGSRGPRRSVV